MNTIDNAILESMSEKYNNMKVFDIHAHIAPAVDDGARNLEISMDLIRRAYKQGTRAIVCSSHSYSHMDHYQRHFQLLRNQVEKENIDVRLYPGCEIDCSIWSMSTVIKDLDTKYTPTINETQYVLIEFGPSASAKKIINDVQKLLQHGYNPILAHIERYSSLFENDMFLNALHELGCLFQVNAYSLNDEMQEQVKERARKLLLEKRVTFIGSDAHRTDHRTYMIQNGIKYICEHCDKVYAQNVCYKNAENILNMK